MSNGKKYFGQTKRNSSCLNLNYDNTAEEEKGKHCETRYSEARWRISNVLGCFAGNGVGDIFKIDGIMRKEEYHSILVHHAMPSGKRLFGNENWIFQQDNDPKHSSKLCQNYLARKEEAGQMTTMEWPPQSPDLSPIELLWEQMDREVLEKKPSSVAELVKVVKEWAEISGDVCDKLVKRMPLLCRAVIDAKGGYFDEKLAPQKKQLVYH